MKLSKLVALSVLLPLAALAAAPTATLSWTPATTRVDGTPVGPSFFAVYAGTSGAEVLLQTGINASPVTLPGIAGQTMCFQVTQIETDSGAESAKSAEVCKTFPASPPAAPTGVTAK